MSDSPILSGSDVGGFVFETTEFDVHMTCSDDYATEEPVIDVSASGKNLNIETNPSNNNDGNIFGITVLESTIDVFDKLKYNLEVVNVEKNEDSSVEHLDLEKHVGGTTIDAISVLNNYVDVYENMETNIEKNEGSSVEEHLDLENTTHVDDTKIDAINVLDNAIDVHESMETNIENNDNNLGEESFDLEQTSSKDRQSIPVSDDVCKLPMGRIKAIMKCDPEVHSVSLKAVFLMTKTTEMFMQWFGKELNSIILKGKKQTINKDDINQIIFNNENLDFLDGIIDE